MVGVSPLAIVMPADAYPTVVKCHTYDMDSYDIHDDLPEPETDKLRWIDIVGLEDTARINDIAQSLGLSELAIAELFHVDERPHLDVEDDLVTLILRVPNDDRPFDTDVITLVLGADFILTVRETPSDVLEPVRNRLEKGVARMRRTNDYLFYALIDLITDMFFPVLESYGDQVEELESELIHNPNEDSIERIHALKRELLTLRHALWPMREAIVSLMRDGVPHVHDDLRPFLRDCADHTFQLLDIVEIYRETAQGLVDLHLSSLSNRMNEVMKVLTMIATTFIPMSFVAGLYGMNFDTKSPFNMPELDWMFGYFYALSLMAVSAAIMMALFWRLGWIFNRKKKRPRG